MRAPRDPRLEGDPAGVPAHHLDDDDPIVRVGRGVQAVDRVDGDLHRGPESEGDVGAREVVVDRLRDADHREGVVLVELVGDPEGVLAADRHEGVDPEILCRGKHLLRAAVTAVRIGAAAAEHRSAQGQNAADPVLIQRNHVPLEQPPPAVADPDVFMVVSSDAGTDHAPDHGVEAGAVASAGEDSNSHAAMLTPVVW